MLICYHFVRYREVINGSKMIGDFKLPRGSETVLVVDDDDKVRKIVTEILHLLGYVVLETSAPKKALEISRNYIGPIHLLLTDIDMPELNGMELAFDLAAVRPETKILYMSGDPGPFINYPNSHRFNPSLFIQKPFTFSTLASRVRAVLEQR